MQDLEAEKTGAQVSKLNSFLGSLPMRTSTPNKEESAEAKAKSKTAVPSLLLFLFPLRVYSMLARNCAANCISHSRAVLLPDFLCPLPAAHRNFGGIAHNN